LVYCPASHARAGQGFFFGTTLPSFRVDAEISTAPGGHERSSFATT